MKNIRIASRIAFIAIAIFTVFKFIPQAKASPYASALNYYASSNAVVFYLNESGGKVTVTYEDGTTNGVYDGISATATNVVAGQHYFYMTNGVVSHTGYSIAVTKIGNGVPTQTSIDSSSFTGANPDSLTNFTYFATPRGIAVNQNPKVGSLFGRVYVSSDASPAKALYGLNPDLTPAITNSAVGIGTFTNSSTSGPWHMRVAPDNNLIVGDYSTAAATLWLFAPDLTSSNLLLYPIGETAGITNGIHGDMFGTARLSGSLANSNLVLWVADGGMPVPGPALDPNITLGPGTSVGMYNNVYRYDIGAGPLPWTNAPNYAFNLGLDVISELIVESDIGPDGKIFAAFGRSNLSNPTINVLDPTGHQVLWTSWLDNPQNSDPWRGDIIGSTIQYPYGGVRVSPDGQYFASLGIADDFLIANLTNGIPDNNTLFVINNSSAGNSRGMDWDIADNLYKVSSAQAELRVFTLGFTATCITSNDITGTNGTFILVTPPVAATTVATTPTASQNYGSPTAGVITINLTTNFLAVPTKVTFTLTGTAVYTNNYIINLGTNVDGIVISSNSVTFPAGTWPHTGNWSVALQLTPSAIPVSGPTLTATLTLLGGGNYSVGSSSAKASVTIINTGPQLLLLSVIPGGITMSRGITNDYVKFVITRLGDLTVASYTVTNINYQGTAIYGTDYTAGAQRFMGSLLSDGSPGIVINPGDIFITNAVGNPLLHANLSEVPTNVTIILTMTNAVTGTNVSSAEGYTYVVSSTNSITLTELDNAYGGNGNGGGITLWSRSLNDPNDSTNWTLTYASENLGTTTVLPVVVPNYTNNETSVYNGGTNDFDVEFGYPVPANIPLSPAMIANGWTNVLKMTVNKNQGSPTAVNLYPQGQKFYGNYALRFSMYLSIASYAIHNIYAGVVPREYAIFGVNHTGTNCNWRPSRTAPVGTSGTTNADGIWFALDEADNAATPADFDAFTSPGLPNAGVTADFVSNAGSALRNIFKDPPFVNTENPLGGEPVDQWADVSVEITKQTNCTIYVDGAPVLTPFSTFTNSTSVSGYGYYTNGTVMLGYLDPDASIGDPGSEFVYYSNIRAVELSPYITAQPVNLIVTNGANVSFISSATFATPPLTNTWYIANTNPTPVSAVQVDTANATNLTSTLTLNSVQAGTNYIAVFSDAAGSVTGLVASLDVIITAPTNQTVNAGLNAQFVLSISGPAPTYQWKTNGVNLANSAHFFGVTSNILTITNVQLSDALTYSVAVTNGGAGVILSAGLSVLASQPTFSTIFIQGTSNVLIFTTPSTTDNTGSFTLQGSTNVVGPYNPISGTTITGASGLFGYHAPYTTNKTMFYRLKHN
jgi:hypothetical protein